MSGLPVRLDLPDEVVEQLALRVAAILADQRPEPDPLLTVEEAADYIRALPQRVYDLKSQGRIPALKDGSRVLFRRSALDAYLQGGSR